MTALPPTTDPTTDPIDGDRPVELVLSAEQLTASSEWTVSGAVRFRRRITTAVRTVEVTLRREELEIEVRDVAERGGAWVGTALHGPAVPPPPTVTAPGVFTLREEVPQVVLSVHPYERVTVQVHRVLEQVRVDGTARREQAVVTDDLGPDHPSRRRRPIA